jgi:hypothetical protein
MSRSQPVPEQLSSEALKRFATLGAKARLEQLDLERRAILAAFPDLRPAPAMERRAAKEVGPAAKPARKRTKMSAVARKAVSERMKKYWAERRKAKAALATGR